MKVFIAGTSFEPDYGGPAVSVSRLATAVAGAGAKVALWAPDGSAVTSDAVPRPAPGMTCLGGSLEEALSTIGAIDIIHDNGLWLPHNHRIAALATRRGIARVVSIRGMLEPWAIRHKRVKKAIAWRLYQKRDLMKAALLHTTSKPEARGLSAYGLDCPVVTIPNGAGLPDLRDKSSGPPVHSGKTKVALFLGRIHPVKGLPMLIEAWSRLRPEGWRLRIAGPDVNGHRAEVEALAARHGLAGTVSFPGPVDGDAKANEYRAASIFVLPTHSENFGMVVAEALSYGVPVLTTHGAPWQELETERCGWWVAPAVESLLSGLAEATSAAPDTLIEMGRRGRALIAARYGWGPIAGQFMAAYQQALARLPS